MISTIVAIVAGLLFTMFLFNRQALRNVLAAVSGQMGKLGFMALKADPASVYRAQIDESSEQLRDANKGLEKYRALIMALNRRVVEATKEQALFESRIKAALSTGDEARAKVHAAELGRIETKLAEYQAQHKTYQETYDAQIVKVKKIQEQIVKAREKANSLGADLQISKAEAELTDLTEKFNSSSVNALDFSAAETEMQSQIDENRSKALVAKDLQSPPTIYEEEALQAESDRTDAVLARFKKA